MGIFRLGNSQALATGGGLAGGGPLAGSGLPRAARAAIGLLILAALVAGLAGWTLAHRPTTLADWQLTGPRSPACIRLVAAPDMSGSMRNLAPARDAALAQVLAWAPKNLRADDEIAVIEWASQAHVALEPTAIGQAAGLAPSHQSVGGDTEAGTMLDALAALPPTRCVTALVVLSDGLLSSAPAGADSLLRSATVTTMTLVQPARSTPNDAWRQTFPFADVEYAPATDADATARTIGQVLAQASGQRLERR